MKQHQRLSSELTDGTDWGQYQTYDKAVHGPTFGGGHDLFVGNDFASGYANPFSYGPTVNGTQDNIYGTSVNEPLIISGLEVFTIGPASGPQLVPEPGSISLFLGALAAVFPRRRRKKP